MIILDTFIRNLECCPFQVLNTAVILKKKIAIKHKYYINIKTILEAIF